MENIITFITTFLIGCLLIVVCGMFWGLVIELLWNWLIVKIFGLCTITWLEGWGLSILASCIFGGTKVTNSK